MVGRIDTLVFLSLLGLDLRPHSSQPTLLTTRSHTLGCPAEHYFDYTKKKSWSSVFQAVLSVTFPEPLFFPCLHSICGTHKGIMTQNSLILPSISFSFAATGPHFHKYLSAGSLSVGQISSSICTR